MNRIYRLMPWEQFLIWRDHRRHIKRVRYLAAHPEHATPEALDDLLQEQRALLKRDGWDL